MHERTVSVILPVQAVDLGTALPYARLAAQTGTGRLWSGQSMGIETHTIFAALAGMGMGLQFGSAVTLMPLRNPYAAALTARSVAAVSGRPYIAGIGPAAASMQRAVLGAPYRSPIGATREYATTMRTLLDGGIASSPDGLWPLQGLSLPPIEAPEVQIGLGVLRGRMAQLAGEVADWAITWLTPVEYLRKHLVDQLTVAALDADRTPPRIASVLHCVLDRPHRDVVGAATNSSDRHLQAPHYVDMLRQAGIEFDSDDVRDRARTLLDHGVIASGSPQDIAAEVGRYHENGVDEVVLNVGGVFLTEGPGAAARDLGAILDAVGGDGR